MNWFSKIHKQSFHGVMMVTYWDPEWKAHTNPYPKDSEAWRGWQIVQGYPGGYEVCKNCEEGRGWHLVNRNRPDVPAICFKPSTWRRLKSKLMLRIEVGWIFFGDWVRNPIRNIKYSLKYSGETQEQFYIRVARENKK